MQHLREPRVSYINFEELPPYVQEKVSTLPGSTKEDWLKKPIKSLKGQSLLQALNQGDEDTVLWALDEPKTFLLTEN